jgi:hypothetical protein
MILIASAEYIDRELQSNFGKIIPSFLPVKNKRLYYFQSLIFETDNIYLSIPENYSVDKNDLDLIKKLNIKILRVPSGLILGESILYCINKIVQLNMPLTILFGDTLICDIPSQDDEYISISKISQNYDWAKSRLFSNSEMTYTGLFNFHDTALLSNKIIEKNYDFINGVEEYIKSKNVKFIVSDEWFDFGHLSTYFNSRSKFTTERHFNKLDIKKNRVLVKSSSQINKIKAEANWFNSIPDSLKIFTPHCYNLVVCGEKASYELEYLFIPVLNELFVFGKLPIFLWKQIINSCLTFLEELHDNQIHLSENTNELFFQKTFTRLNQLQNLGIIDIFKTWNFNGEETPSLNEIAIETAIELDSFNFSTSSIMHGDFCFSNILYDFRSQSIKVIDPRGIDNNDEISIYGDTLYDITKLAHSIIGLYDFIIAGYYELTIKSKREILFHINVNENVLEIQKFFLVSKFKGRDIKLEYYINQLIHLFLSMLPLHSENNERQFALMSNALRLYNLKKELYD